MLIQSDQRKKKELAREIERGFSVDQYVNAHQYLVQQYRNFKSPQLEITESLDILEPLGKDPDPYNEVKTAIICENFVRETMVQQLDETGRADVPRWVKAGLALITASHADDLTDLVISDQPLPNKTGRIHYLDIQSESSKGDLAAGTRMFDALRGFIGTSRLSDEKVDDEPVGVVGSTDYAKTLEYRPMIPRSVEITDGTQIIRDDGNGNLIGDIQAPGGGFTNTINYITGAASLRFAVATTGPVVTNYSYNIEAAALLPKFGISIRSTQVEARSRALAAEWSQQAVFDILKDWGVDTEPTIMDAGAKILQMERFKHVVNHLYARASGGTMVFDNTTPSGIDYQQHINSFGILLTRLQNEIWKNTQRVRPNVVVFAPDIWFLFQYTRGFNGDKAPGTTDALAGPKKAGTLTTHNLTCIADPTFAPSSAVLTYRGGDILNTAAIKGTYIDLYKAPVHQVAFRKDTAFLTEYALHIINPEMLGTIQVVNL